VLPLVQARTVVVVGVFHRYRRFGIRSRLVFDPYRAWRTPDGPVPVSALREEVLARLSPADWLQDAASHDAEHSVEALVYWLRHQRADLEILPVLVPAAPFERLEELGCALASALAAAARARGLEPGTDLAIVISSDAVHYGPDFRYVPWGEGGVEAYSRAVARDLEIVEGPLAGPVERGAIASLYASFVDPADPDHYRHTWCGRFSIPLGLVLLSETARGLGLPAPVGYPLAYATSIGLPALPLEAVGLGATAPASLYHFVGQPAVLYALPSSRP
jgi:predicted class III extradiol MEMO1 family dioxygenase